MKSKNELQTAFRMPKADEDKDSKFLQIADRITLGYGLLLLTIIIYDIAIIINFFVEF